MKLGGIGSLILNFPNLLGSSMTLLSSSRILTSNPGLGFVALPAFTGKV